MKVVFFINKTNGFPKSMISFMEANFPEINKSYYTIDRRNEEDLPNLSNVHRISSYNEFITNKELIKDIRTADKIVISGVFTLQYVLPIYGKKIMKKAYWQFWGGDYEVLRDYKFSIKLMFRKKIVSMCINIAKGIILLTEPEKKTFKEVFKDVKDDKLHIAVVPSSPEYDEILVKMRGKKEEKESSTIVIGNSATKSNQHYDIFRKMRHLDLSNVKIYCPLSYGDAQYRNEVIEKGKKVFNENFYPIIKYMSFEKYIEFLNSCDVGIYNNNRQQALGNISLMLNLGKKVYVPETLKLYYEQFGYKLFSIDDIERENIEEIFSWNIRDSENNIKCHDFRKQVIYNDWSKILNL